MKRNKSLLVFFISIFILVELSRGQNNRKTEVNVGVVTDVGTVLSDIEMRCINLSLADFYSSRPQFQTRLIPNIADSRNDVVGAAAAALKLIKNKQVPIVSYSATSPSLTSLRSPYFFRATYEDSFQVNAISSIIKLFGWREVVIVYVDNTFGEGIMPHLTDALQEINVRIPYRSVISLNATDHEISLELSKMMTMPTRVFIVHMSTSLASRIFTKINEIGLMKAGYVWILTNGIADQLSSINETGIEAMQGVLGVKTYVRKFKELEKFRARWRKMFPEVELNAFGLWAYDAATALAIAIEEAGTNNMTFSNVDLGRNVSELEALGLSQYGPKLIQILSQVQFKGLAGDFCFFKGQLQPSVLEIVNQSVGALSTWKDHLKHIIWPGEANSVPKGWEIPTNGKRLRIGVPKRTGYTDLVEVKKDPITNSQKVKGFCIDFFKAVTEAMPYDVSYDFFPFEKSDGTPAGDHNDLVYQVYLGKYDAVVGDTTILANRSSYVDFTFPYTKSGMGLIVPVEDQVKRNSISFLKPLTWKLWMTSFFFFFLIGFTVWFVEHRINPDFRGPAKYQASTIFWFAFSTMVFAPRERVLSFGARLLVITCLASLLTTRQLDPTITSMRSLIEKGEKVGYTRTSFIFGKLTEAGFARSSLIPFDTADDCDELLRKGPENGGVSAAFMEVPYMRLFLGQYCTYQVVEEPFSVDGFGFVFPIGSPLVADVSRAILKVAESTKGRDLEQAWFKNKDETCPDPVTNPDPNPSTKSRQLGVDSFWVLFLIAFAMCVFNLGKFSFFIFKKTQVNNLWQEFNQPDMDSYLNRVEKCSCSSSRHMPDNNTQEVHQANNQPDTSNPTSLLSECLLCMDYGEHQ
ncbi:BnaA04g14620D [Brassica napus]|uniref:Glutamate receptor n=1 Tax=Brassica napus TaxID=3708 RepID=A0A078I467_BRANA|nr:BnaA04g14620D [Brassica napus]